jgi:hypothetical protein
MAAHEHTPNVVTSEERWQRAANAVLAVTKILEDNDQRLNDPIGFVARIAGVNSNDVISARMRARMERMTIDHPGGRTIVNPDHKTAAATAEQDPVWIGNVALPRQLLAGYINEQHRLDQEQLILDAQIATLHGEA